MVCPPAVLPRSMPTAFPGHGRTGNRSPARSDDDSCQSFLHIGSQCRVERKLRRLRAESGSLGVPLRRRRAILQSAAPSGGLAPQLPGAPRPPPVEPAGRLLSRVAPPPHELDLPPLAT